MPDNLLGHAVLGAAIWAIFAVAIIAGVPEGPKDEIWVVTSSEKVASHPTLVRSAVIRPEQVALLPSR